MKFAIVFAIAAAALVSVNAAPAAKPAAKPAVPETKLVDVKGFKANKKLTILKAVYGRNTQKSKDVTKIVQEQVAKGKDFKVTNKLFTDPCPGYGKKLEVVYTVNNQVKIMKLGEQATFVIKNLK